MVCSFGALDKEADSNDSWRAKIIHVYYKCLSKRLWDGVTILEQVAIWGTNLGQSIGSTTVARMEVIDDVADRVGVDLGLAD
ncbi:hypothetical protein YTPLAS18_30050 [Nitrospira sp.]|nr:hypothetical protein YTPLAS18_30050 [Nitrospira sp.]